MRFCPQCSLKLEAKNRDGFERLQCSSARCSFIHWNNPTPVAAGLVRRGNHYILARNHQWSENMFSMITGFVEKDELPEAAIVRELKEELGLSCNHAHFIGHFMFKPRNQLMIAYHLDAHGEITLSQEIAEVKILPTQQLQQYDFSPFSLTTNIVQKWLQAST